MAPVEFDEEGLIVVGMNDPGFCSFEEHAGIMCQRLGGSHVIIIFSQKGAVLAKIAPAPFFGATVEETHARIQHAIREIARLHNLRQNFFYGMGMEVRTVYAAREGSIVLPNRKEWVDHQLSLAGLPTTGSHNYVVQKDEEVDLEAEEVKVKVKRGPPPELHVNGEKLA